MNAPVSAGHTYFARRSAALAWLALCPLLSASSTPANALAFGVAACAVFGLGSLAAMTLGHRLPLEVRQAALAVLVAGLAAAVARVMMIWQADSLDAIGRAIPLLAAGGILIAAVDTLSCAQPGQGLPARMITACLYGLGALLVIGTVRVLAGRGLQLAERPAGAFLILGLLLAVACAMRNRAAASRPTGL